MAEAEGSRKAGWWVFRRRLVRYNLTSPSSTNPMFRTSVAVAAVFAGVVARPAHAQRAFQVTETTIADVHVAMRGGGLTCRALVQAYLSRIEAYDKQGPAINSITVVNPDALAI